MQRIIIFFILTIYFPFISTACKEKNNKNHTSTHQNNNQPTIHVQSIGARLRAPIIGLSLLNGRLWVGTGTAADIDEPTRLRSTLVSINVATGEAIDYEAQLPEMEYNLNGEMLHGPAATAAVLRVKERTLAVSSVGLLEIHDDHTLTVHPVIAGGAHVMPTGAAARLENHLWVTHERGISLLNTSTFEEIQSWTTAEIGNVWAHSPTVAVDHSLFCILVDHDTGETSLAHISEEGVSRVSHADIGATSGRFSAVVARPDRVEAYATFASWQPDTPALMVWDGQNTPVVLAREKDLGDPAAEPNDRVFGPQQLALDATQNVLAIGGGLQSTMLGLKGGGLLWFRFTDGAIVRITPQNSPFFALHSGPVVMDGGVTYAALLQPCSDIQLGHMGVFALSFDASGTLIVGRPLLSGIRALATDNEGRLYAGLRDDNPGYACHGIPITTGFYEIHANGWGRYVRFLPADGHSDVPAFASVVDAAQNVQGKWALATWRNGLLMGEPSAVFLWNPAIQWRVSTYSTSVLWENENVLWLSGFSSHAPGDPPHVADVGPMGAVRLVFDAQGNVTDARHFVARIRPDLHDGSVVQGLPSGEVVQILPLPDGRILLVCASERLLPSGSDAWARPFFQEEDQIRIGGLAIVNPETLEVEIPVPQEEIPDPQVAVILEDGSWMVLDATRGALQIKNGVVMSFDEAVPDGFPRALYPWRKSVVVMTNRYARVPGVLQDISGAFYSASEVDGTLYLGSAEGLVRISLQDTQTPLRAYPSTAPIPFVP